MSLSAAQAQAPADELREPGCYAALTEGHIDVQHVMDQTRSDEAGAIVLFIGMTRNSFGGVKVEELQYTAYAPMALRTMMEIAKETTAKHSLKGFAVVHRLGVVPVSELSIVLAVSTPHRQDAWRAGEEAMNEVKRRVEIWKYEVLKDGKSVWRANRDGAAGQEIEDNKP